MLASGLELFVFKLLAKWLFYRHFITVFASLVFAKCLSLVVSLEIKYSKSANKEIKKTKNKTEIDIQIQLRLVIHRDNDENIHKLD